MYDVGLQGMNLYYEVESTGRLRAVDTIWPPVEAEYIGRLCAVEAI